MLFLKDNIIDMKNFFPLFFITLTLLTGCNKSQKNTPETKEPHYQEVEDLHIEWKDLFNQNNDRYYCYVYGVACSACSYLRESVTTFAKSEKEHFYFIYPSDDIVFVDDEETAIKSLGAKSIEDVSIYTTPTLIEISNKVITNYTRDYYQIKSFVESK